MSGDTLEVRKRQVENLFQKFRNELLQLKSQQLGVFDRLMKKADDKKINDLRQQLGIKK